MPTYIKQILHTQLFSILNIIFGFGTLFILIKYMEIDKYGEYVLIQGFIALAGLLFSQNIYSYARMKIPGSTEIIQYGYLKTVIILVFSLFIITLVLSFFFKVHDKIWSFFEIKDSISSFVLIMLSLQLINLEFMRFFIAIKKIYLKNYAQFIQKIFLLFGSMYLLYYNTLTLINFLSLYIIGQLIVFIMFMINIKIRLLVSSSFMKDVLYDGYKVAIPLIPIGIMSIVLNYTDTLMIAKFIGKDAVAQYGFASQIISIAMMMIGTSIVLTLFPHATEAHNKNNLKSRDLFFSKMFKYGVVLSIIFFILISFISTWLISILGITQYKDVPKYLFVLGIFPFFQHLYNVSSHYLQLMKVFNIQIYIAILVMLENLILNYFMIQKYAVMGAAYASLISFVTLALVYSCLSFTFYKKTVS